MQSSIKYIRPQLTKDIYYSLFVHEMLEMSRRNGSCLYMCLEAAYTIAFTPLPTGWCRGQRLAMTCRRNENHLLKFAREMVEIHGCVSACGHTRRQVSHPKNVSIKKLMISLRNLLKLIELANTIDDTAAVIKKSQVLQRRVECTWWESC